MVSRWLRSMKLTTFILDPLQYPECGGEMKVVWFIEPAQAGVIEAILKRCGLWQSQAPRAPPEVHDLVLELDAGYADNSISSADELQELTYVDINTFLKSFESSRRRSAWGRCAPAVGSTRILCASTCILCSGRPQFRSPSQKRPGVRLCKADHGRLCTTARLELGILLDRLVEIKIPISDSRPVWATRRG